MAPPASIECSHSNSALFCSPHLRALGCHGCGAASSGRAAPARSPPISPVALERPPSPSWSAPQNNGLVSWRAGGLVNARSLRFGTPEAAASATAVAANTTEKDTSKTLFLLVFPASQPAVAVAVAQLSARCRDAETTTCVSRPKASARRVKFNPLATCHFRRFRFGFARLLLRPSARRLLPATLSLSTQILAASRVESL